MGKPPLHRRADWLKHNQPWAMLHALGTKVNGSSGLAVAYVGRNRQLKWHV